MVNNKIVDIAGLGRYHENLKTILANNLTEAKEYADGLVDGKFDEVGAAEQALADAKADADAKYQIKGNYETEGAAAQALTDAKAYVDGKVDGKFDEAGAAAEALEAAKAYADDLVMVDGVSKFDAVGSAAQALADAKADAEAKYQVIGNYETAGTAAGLNDAMDLRVKALEAIDHEKLATDASAAAVATILDGAPEKFDTLKEVAEWISATDSASSAADLVTRVTALEAIDHDAYVEADKTVLENAKSYADGLAGNYDEAGAAAQALADAKTDAEAKYQVKGDYATNTQVNAKQDTITDLETIRSGAAAGATALQAVPEEYVTETELTGKGYLTANDFEFANNNDIDSLFGVEA